jgi:nucleotide-binding universal stress UspA family protein
VSSLRKILLPTDFSTCAAAAAAFGLGLARTTGATVTFVHIVHMPDWGHPNLAEWVALSAKLLDAAASALASLEEDARQGGVRVDSVANEGDPAQEIVRVAADAHVDLIVMGTHGKKGLDRIEEKIVGSVTQSVLRTAPCPVTVVRR